MRRLRWLLRREGRLGLQRTAARAVAALRPLQFFYEGRVFRRCRSATARIEIRVIYQHCLKLLGRQQGPLLYTTTLLPGEEVKIFEFDRYRRVRSATERVSVHSRSARP